MIILNFCLYCKSFYIRVISTSRKLSPWYISRFYKFAKGILTCLLDTGEAVSEICKFAMQSIRENESIANITECTVYVKYLSLVLLNFLNRFFHLQCLKLIICSNLFWHNFYMLHSHLDFWTILSRNHNWSNLTTQYMLGTSLCFLSKKLHTLCSVLVGSRNGFREYFYKLTPFHTIELK